MRTPESHSKSGESGATMVEAAIALPLFFAVLLGSIRILVICYEGIRFQYEVSETTRITFTSDKAARGGKVWEDYFKETLATRASKSGLSGLGVKDNGNGKFTIEKDITPKHIFKNKGKQEIVKRWPPTSAKPGETVSIEISSEEPLLPEALADIASPTITLTAKAVAMINRGADE
jgi:hypothetical protein